jgi:hypothetical protein
MGENGMIKHFITVSGEIITGQHVGDMDADFSNTRFNGHKKIEIPKDKWVIEGDKLVYYDKNWDRISDVELIKNKLKPMPVGFKIINNELIEMTWEERIIAGLEEVPEGYKIEGDNLIPMTHTERVIAGLEELPHGFHIVYGELVKMSEGEKLKARLITQDDINIRISEGNQAELSRRLSELQAPQALAQAELDEEFAALCREPQVRCA